ILCLSSRPPPRWSLFPYTTLFRSETEIEEVEDPFIRKGILLAIDGIESDVIIDIMSAEISAMEERHREGRSLLERAGEYAPSWRSEEHTSELQSRENLVCRLLLEK